MICIFTYEMYHLDFPIDCSSVDTKVLFKKHTFKRILTNIYVHVMAIFKICIHKIIGIFTKCHNMKKKRGLRLELR